MEEKTCIECGGIMIEGFILDLTYGGQMVPRWVRGKPERSVWTGVKSKGKECYTVATFPLRPVRTALFVRDRRNGTAQHVG